MFVRHEMVMELLETHFLNNEDRRCEVAVRYRVLRTGRSTGIVSTVMLAKEDAGWRIIKEHLLSAIDVSCRGGSGDFVPVADLSPSRADPQVGRDLLDGFNWGFRIVPGGCAKGRCGHWPTGLGA
jgi:hypothetical protein